MIFNVKRHAASVYVSLLCTQECYIATFLGGVRDVF